MDVLRVRANHRLNRERPSDVDDLNRASLNHCTTGLACEPSHALNTEPGAVATGVADVKLSTVDPVALHSVRVDSNPPTTAVEKRPLLDDERPRRDFPCNARCTAEHEFFACADFAFHGSVYFRDGNIYYRVSNLRSVTYDERAVRGRDSP